jgi:hypothetical protein
MQRLGKAHILVVSSRITWIVTKSVYRTNRGVFCLDHRNRRVYLEPVEASVTNGYLIEYRWPTPLT